MSTWQIAEPFILAFIVALSIAITIVWIYVKMGNNQATQEENLTEENGQLIDYTSTWAAILNHDPSTEKYGWRVFNKEGSFIGILDENKIAIWQVDETSLRQFLELTQQ